MDFISSAKLSAIDQAMNLASQRQSLLSNNLANINVPGYKRKDMDFNLSLNEAMGVGDPGHEDQLRQFQNFVQQQASDQTSLREDGNNVDLEREAMGIAETQLRYQALSEMASNTFSNIQIALK